MDDSGVPLFLETPIYNDRIRGPPCAASSCLEVAFDYVVARSHASESHQVQARPVESVKNGRRLGKVVQG